VKNRILALLLAVILALSVGLIGCTAEVPEITEYTLTISSTEGGAVTTPGEGVFTYNDGEKVNLAAIPDEGYRFINWTGDVGEIADVEDSTTTITMKNDYSITATFVVKQYSLVIYSIEGGSVTTPGENAYSYNKGEVVNLVAVADEGYVFINWTGDIGTVADINAASTTITMNGGYSITASFAKGIWDWHDLDAVRDNLEGSYVLMNDLDATTAGYAELASTSANGGKGWEPIGSISTDPIDYQTIDRVDAFEGGLDGQKYEIRGLFINRPDEDGVALFRCIGEGDIVKNLGVMNAEVTGHAYVGTLVGYNLGTVNNSYSGGSVTGVWDVGGLVGENGGTVSNCYCTGGVTSRDGHVGGLVGFNYGPVSNSHYSHNNVLINGKNVITIGALFAEDFEQWLANDKSFNVGEILTKEDDYYIIKGVSDFKSLLAFGQDSSLKFRLTTDLDLAAEPNFYIPYLAGEFDGNGHKILNLSFAFDFVSHVGLFGHLASGGKVSDVGVENVNLTGRGYVGSLVGWSRGHANNSYASGTVTGAWGVGGLVGALSGGTVSDCCYTGSVTGGWGVGGLLGDNFGGALTNSHFTGSVTGVEVGGLVGHNYGSVSNSHYSYDQARINGRSIITIGALFGKDFEQWLANNKFLDVDGRLHQENAYYVMNNISDFKQMLVFGQESSLKFRLNGDLNLSNEPDFYIPYLAGEFNGNGHTVANLSFNIDFISQVGLFGYVGPNGKITEVGVENVRITGLRNLGGVAGGNAGTISSSYCSGRVTGADHVGGLVGCNVWGGTVIDSYSTGSVAGHWRIGGLVGWNQAAVSRSYSTASVTSEQTVGGLVGLNYGAVSNSFWDTETSGQSASDGGTGKTTAEMRNIATFSDAGWNMGAVANPSTRNPAYIWNIVDGQTYPFLSWQS